MIMPLSSQRQLSQPSPNASPPPKTPASAANDIANTSATSTTCPTTTTTSTSSSSSSSPPSSSSTSTAPSSAVQATKETNSDVKHNQSPSSSNQSSTHNSGSHTEQKRPMNAFLLFCKRQRSLVREQHPNLENRGITRILGDWWTNLDKEQKSKYTDMARQHKEAFMKANPDFRWCKTSNVGSLNNNNSNNSTSVNDNCTNKHQIEAPKPPKKRFLERNDSIYSTRDNNSSFSRNDTSLHGADIVPCISLDQDILDRVIDKAFSEDSNSSKPSAINNSCKYSNRNPTNLTISLSNNSKTPLPFSSTLASTTAATTSTSSVYPMNVDEPVDFSMNRTINTTRQQIINNLVEKMLSDGLPTKRDEPDS